MKCHIDELRKVCSLNLKTVTQVFEYYNNFRSDLKFSVRNI